MSILKRARVAAKAAWENHKGTVACIVTGLGLGTVIGGSWTALADHKRIVNLEKNARDMNKWANESAEWSNNFVDRTTKEIDDLKRQNNLLMERALKETEGEAE